MSGASRSPNSSCEGAFRRWAAAKPTRSFHASRYKAPWQLCQSPAGHRRHRGRQRPGDRPRDMEEVQQRAQGGCGQLRGAAGLLGATHHHEPRHVSLAEPLDVQCRGTDRDTALQKRANRIDVTPGGGFTQPSFPGQVASVAGQGLLNGPGGKRCRRRGRALVLEVRQQRTQRPVGQMMLITGVESGPQKLLRPPWQVGDVKVCCTQPTADVRYQVQLRLQGPRCVALPRKLGREPRRERLERTNDADE